jgi:hypothetical protein
MIGTMRRKTDHTHQTQIKCLLPLRVVNLKSPPYGIWALLATRISILPKPAEPHQKCVDGFGFANVCSLSKKSKGVPIKGKGKSLFE